MRIKGRNTQRESESEDSLKGGRCNCRETALFCFFKAKLPTKKYLNKRQAPISPHSQYLPLKSPSNSRDVMQKKSKKAHTPKQKPTTQIQMNHSCPLPNRKKRSQQKTDQPLYETNTKKIARVKKVKKQNKIKIK